MQLDTICALALAIGLENLAVFVPVVQKQMQRHKIQHEKFSKLAAKLLSHDPPCMSNATDWEANNAWLDEMAPAAKQDLNSYQLPDIIGQFP